MTSAPEAAPTTPGPGTRDCPLSVAQLVRGAARVLDRVIGTVWLEGEVASLTLASSGHAYFSLAGAGAQIRAVMWRSEVRRLRLPLEEGTVLLCRGYLGIYERDGKFQFHVQAAYPAGQGADALRLEELKKKLAAEGLFDPARKRELPSVPKRIGVVTSARGAAVRDIIRALERRFPVAVLIANAQVQGASAPGQIVRALAALAETDCDLVIVGRGGGSASDLSAFNDERVVRQVAASPIPTISAVGHEIDLTLTDLAADRRASTPTMAAEMAVPVWSELGGNLIAERNRLDREMGLRLRSARQELDQLTMAGRGLLDSRLADLRRQLTEVAARVAQKHPSSQLAVHRAAWHDLNARLIRAMGRSVDGRARQLADHAGRLHAMSPLVVLERGYAIAESHIGVLTDASAVATGDSISVRLAKGRVHCVVEDVEVEPR